MRVSTQTTCKYKVRTRRHTTVSQLVNFCNCFCALVLSHKEAAAHRWALVSCIDCCTYHEIFSNRTLYAYDCTEMHIHLFICISNLNCSSCLFVFAFRNRWHQRLCIGSEVVSWLGMVVLSRIKLIPDCVI